MQPHDLMIVQWMLYGLLGFCLMALATIIYCGINSGPDPRRRLPYYIVDDLRKRGHLPKNYR